MREIGTMGRSSVDAQASTTQAHSKQSTNSMAYSNGLLFNDGASEETRNKDTFEL